MTAFPAHQWPLHLQTASRAALHGDAHLTPNEAAIANSVLYASLFEFPLTLAELRQTLVESTQTPSQILATFAASPTLQEQVEFSDGLFFPRGRRDLIEERRQRETRSREFLDHHQGLLRVIAAFPYVEMVALSGSVAHLNLSGAGDLDLFIVTRGRRVWSVTVAIIVLAKLMGRRRTLCANFVMADTRLVLDQPDLFTASQVIHLKPLVGRSTFGLLLAANPFVRRFYPNFHEASCDGHLLPRRPVTEAVKRGAEWLLAVPWLGVEAFCRSAYSWYLRRQAGSWESPDQVRLDRDCLKLHTRSHRRSVLERFEQVTREHGI